jgi:tyrosinase
MFNVWSSINDPLFYLHHGNLDRIWHIWQKKQPSNLYAIGAPRSADGLGGETTLDDLLYMSDFITPTVPVRQLMDPLNQNQQGPLCYIYA